MVDKNFALVAKDGTVRYPYKKGQRATGRYGFALSKAGQRDAYGDGLYTDDIREVIRKVVLEGWKVRARTEDGSKEGSVGLGRRTADNYWVAPHLRTLVAGAEIQPIPTLPE